MTRPGPITSQCLPPEGSSVCTLEVFPEGKYGEKEYAFIHPDMADFAFEDEVRKLIAYRTREENWTPVTVRLLDAYDIEQRRTVIK